MVLQVKELAAEVMEHLRSSLDSHVLTQAFAEARARSSAAKALRRKEAAVKVPLLQGSCCEGAPFAARLALGMRPRWTPQPYPPQPKTNMSWLQVMVDPQAAAQVHARKQQRKAPEQEAASRTPSSATGLPARGP